MAMNFSTAKAIVRTFKNEGRILKKNELRDYSSEYLNFEKLFISLWDQQKKLNKDSSAISEASEFNTKSREKITAELNRLKRDAASKKIKVLEAEPTNNLLRSEVALSQLAQLIPLLQKQQQYQQASQYQYPTSTVTALFHPFGLVNPAAMSLFSAPTNQVQLPSIKMATSGNYLFQNPLLSSPQINTQALLDRLLVQSLGFAGSTCLGRNSFQNHHPLSSMFPYAAKSV